MNSIPVRIEAARQLQLLLSFQQKTTKKLPTPAAPPLTGRALANARLLKAATERDITGLRLALEAGADVNAAQGKQGRTALMLAIRGGSDAVDSGINMREMESTWRREGERLGEAMAGEVPAVVAFLLRAGAQVNLPDAVGGTALHYAVASGNEGLCRELLRRKANVNAGAASGLTPLLMAVIRHDPAIVELLLRAGADPKNRPLPGHLPLLLLALYQEPAEKGENGGMASTLRSTMEAMMGGMGGDTSREEVVELLLGAGLDPSEAAEEGWTALYMAAELGSPRIVRRLVAKGARVNAVLNNGSTPLALAAWSGRADNVRVLLELGANPNATDKDGDTALMLAAEKASYAAVELLLKSGAKAQDRNKKGQSARDVAARLRHTAIVRLIDAHTAALPSISGAK